MTGFENLPTDNRWWMKMTGFENLPTDNLRMIAYHSVQIRDHSLALLEHVEELSSLTGTRDSGYEAGLKALNSDASYILVEARNQLEERKRLDRI